MNEITPELTKLIKRYNITIQQVDSLYPRFYESFMNLSVTGVSPRVYFHWKKEGLIDNLGYSKSGKGWVKINLIEYVWIKIIVIMREFGIPLEQIKETKELLFSNINKIIKEKDEFILFIKNNKFYSEDKINEIEKILNEISESINNAPEEYDSYNSFMALILLQLILFNDSAYLVLYKNENKFNIDFLTTNSFDDKPSYYTFLLETPCLQIPIKPLITEFIDDLKNEKHLITLNLLNFKEKKVIQAIREKAFTQIIIKMNGNKDSYIIEIEKDGNILDSKAKEIKRILGLNEYSEVTIKYRNEKNLYFKNKTRI
jgi:DNA-binding transcriptional MerR regulator